MTNPSTINNSARCTYHFPNGMRCRLLGFAGQQFCPKHARVVPAAPAPDSADVAPSLTAGLDDLTSGEEIATFLSRLLVLTAQGKISPRRAAVLTYIASQLLHSVRTMIAEEKHTPNTEIIFDAPRPTRPAPAQSDQPDTNATNPSSTFTLPLDPTKKVSS